jgi:hypothetical protein
MGYCLLGNWLKTQSWKDIIQARRIKFCVTLMVFGGFIKIKCQNSPFTVMYFWILINEWSSIFHWIWRACNLSTEKNRAKHPLSSHNKSCNNKSICNHDHSVCCVSLQSLFSCSGLYSFACNNSDDKRLVCSLHVCSFWNTNMREEA